MLTFCFEGLFLSKLIYSFPEIQSHGSRYSIIIYFNFETEGFKKLTNFSSKSNFLVQEVANLSEKTCPVSEVLSFATDIDLVTDLSG